MKSGIESAFCAGLLLYLVFLLRFGHLFDGAADYVLAPLLFVSHLSIILGCFGLAAGLFWWLVFAVGKRHTEPKQAEALCMASSIAGAAGFFALPWVAVGIFPNMDVRTFAGCLGVGAGCAVLLWVLSRPSPRRFVLPFVPSSRVAVVLLAVAAAGNLIGSRISVDHLCRRPQGIAEAVPTSYGEDAEKGPEASTQGLLNILLLTVDTLRADHLGCYGFERRTSPAVDSLAARGVLFTNAYAQRPKTSPSFASILTGTYPQRHGVRGVRQVLPCAAYTLAEVLRDSGYTTCGVVTNGNLFPDFGFDQGFDEYFYGHRGARRGTEMAQDWLSKEPRAPFFLWVHHTDPHTPYEPPAPYDSLFVSETPLGQRPLKIIKRMALGGIMPKMIVNGPLDLDYYISQYDGEIAYTDHWIGELLTTLRSLGLEKHTLVVFTADHGESLGEHNYYFEHGLFTYEPSAKIPLAFCLPGVVRQGARDDLVIESVDIMPTILDLVELGAPPSCQGVSFADILEERQEDPARNSSRYAYVEAGYAHHYRPGYTFAMTDGRFKFVFRDAAWVIRPKHLKGFIYSIIAIFGGGAASNELYDISRDPREQVNLIEQHPHEAMVLRVELESFVEQMKGAGRLPVERGDQALDERTLESLRALGYVR